MTRPNPFSATITWRINWNQAKLRQKCVQSKYVEVGGKDCRLLVYPSGKPKLAPLHTLYEALIQRACTHSHGLQLTFDIASGRQIAI